jgi:hypothetical protein
MSYSAWGNDLLDPGTGTLLSQSLDNLRADGANWVALNVFWFQDTLSSTTIGPDYTRWSTTPESLERAVQELHSRGIKVMLKPMVDVKTGAWRGTIPASSAWFDAYQSFVRYWADWATKKGVDSLCVGTEFKATESWSAQWRSVISEARSKFAGPLTYGANHDSFSAIDWWDALDYIGIDAYFQLTSKYNPSLGELQAAWAARAGAIEAWLGGIPPEDRKRILFTEIGYRNWDGTNTHPWDASSMGATNLDPQEQANCYYAALSQTWDRPWMGGYYWWIWDTNPAGSWAANDYTPQNLPAELRLREFYTPEPATLLLLAGGLAALARRRPRSTPTPKHG